MFTYNPDNNCTCFKLSLSLNRTHSDQISLINVLRSQRERWGILHVCILFIPFTYKTTRVTFFSSEETRQFVINTCERWVFTQINYDTYMCPEVSRPRKIWITFSMYNISCRFLELSYALIIWICHTFNFSSKQYMNVKKQWIWMRNETTKRPIRIQTNCKGHDSVDCYMLTVDDKTNCFFLNDACLDCYHKWLTVNYFSIKDFHLLDLLGQQVRYPVTCLGPMTVEGVGIVVLFLLYS